MNRGPQLRYARRPVSEDERRRIIAAYRNGVEVEYLALRFHRGKQTIREVIQEGSPNHGTET